MKAKTSITRLVISAVLAGGLFSSDFIRGHASKNIEALPPTSAQAPQNPNPSDGRPPHKPKPYPPDFPATPFPAIKGCSDDQEQYLREAWRRAHYFTWRADKLLAHIMAQPTEAKRAALWNHDYVVASDESDWGSNCSDDDKILDLPSARRWFGPYNQKRAGRAREGVNKALKRFEKEGKIVEGIRTLRCGQPIAPDADGHIDACPAGNPGSNGPPSGYHALIGTIVTCPSFWDQTNDASVCKDREDRIDSSARKLVHEIFHWLSIDGVYVTDLHGGHKYYGYTDARQLAENNPDWAIHNNDNYAWFMYYVGRYEPSFSAVYGEKEGSGTGGVFVDISWEELNSWRGKLASEQYLSDVETYVREGQRRYTGVWRIGKGAGALWASEWPAFAKKWEELRKTQDLIDIEVYPSDDTLMYLGVYRVKQADSKGDGGLLRGMTWDGLVKKWNELSAVAWLADVETYVENGERRFLGVWIAGPGNSNLLMTTDRKGFDNKVKELSPTKQLIDYDRFINDDGQWTYIGVWHHAKNGGTVHMYTSKKDFLADWEKFRGSYTLLDVEEYSALPARIK